MGKIICIDAGHGGTDPGASGNGVIEKEVTLSTALKTGEALKKQGFNVIFTRNADKYVSLGQRCQTANNSAADLFISIHVNAAANEQASGTEVLCYEKNSFASLLQEYLIKELSTKDRGVKERKDLAVLNGTRMNAALVEIAFLSNKEDAKLLKQELFLEKCAAAITMAVCKYYGVEYKEDTDMDGKIISKKINVVLNGEKTSADGYFYEDKNLFTADFIKKLGYCVGYDKNSKEVIINGDGDAREIEVIAKGKAENVKAILRDGFNYVLLRELSRIGIIKADYKDGKVYIDRA